VSEAIQQPLDAPVTALIRAKLAPGIEAMIGHIERMQKSAERHSLAHLAVDIARVRSAADELDALIDQIAAGATGDVNAGRLRHDLRTPLNAIKGYGELILEEAHSEAQVLASDLEAVLGIAATLLSEINLLGDFAEGNRSSAPASPGASVAELLHAVPPLRAGRMPAASRGSCRVLVVDDDAANRDLLSRRLGREGHRTATAANGTAALELARGGGFDLVLLDMMMPGLSGFEVLSLLKADDRTCHIPVIMISALDEIEGTVRCIEAGAEDYLPKPFNPVLLRARISASLEKKLLRDRERAIAEELRAEKERSEALLRNILPGTIIERLRRGETVIADYIPEATILFSDLVDFTAITGRLRPEETVTLLGALFAEFDGLTARFGLEKIKTIGDGYMVAGGLPDARPDHAAAVAEMALHMRDVTATASTDLNQLLQLRIGIHSGPVVAGVIGTHKFLYDVWGDTVNTAKRIESYGAPDRIQVSAATRKILGDAYAFKPRGLIKLKGKGPMEIFFLDRAL
jgi:adenylate cyclase